MLHLDQGNTLSQTDENGQLSSYTYNSRQQRIGHTVNGQSTSYAYNPEGIRTQQTSASQSTHYLVDQNRDYAQVLAEYNSTGLHTSYSYGDDLISQTRSTSPSTTTTHYYHYDGLGSTRALSDTTGALTDTYVYRQLLEKNQLLGSMSAKGNCYDNACAESFFHSLKVEAIHGERFTTREAMRQTVFEYIETDYNRVRLNSANGYRSPVNFEAVFKQSLAS